MSLFGWLEKVRLPTFQVGIYGKLPCYKDFLYASPHEAFNLWRDTLSKLMSELIQAQHGPPYVMPDRRFAVHLPTYDKTLVGCLFESNDGSRIYPFSLAAVLEDRIQKKPFPVFWQSLEQVWHYLDAYYAHLAEQSDEMEVYRRVRGVVHRIEAFVPEVWAPNGNDTQPKTLTSALASLPDFPFRLQANPTLIFWPTPDWRDKGLDEVQVSLGRGGLEDLPCDWLSTRARVDEEETP